MIRSPPRSTRTDTLFPDTTLFRSVVERLDVGFFTGHHGEWFRVDRENRAQLLEFARVLELAGAVIGVVAHIGLHHAQVQFAGLDGVHVEHRTAGGFDRAADAVRGAVFIDQPADGVAGGVVHAGDAAREIGRAHV